MVPSLLAAAALSAPAAPVPKDTLPNPAGPAPRVTAVRADASGTVWVTAQVYEKQKVQIAQAVIKNGQQVIEQREVEQMTSNYVRKTLGEFGGKFAAADGTPLTTEDATRRVKDGATLLITADGKSVAPGWLKAVAPSTVVMTAEGLGHAFFTHGHAPLPTTAAPRLAMLGTDDKGAVRLPVNPNGANMYGQVYYNDFGFDGGGLPPGRIIRGGRADFVESYGSAGAAATPVGSDGKKALADVKFDAYEVNGRMVSRASALARLKAGGLVLIAGDTRFPDAEYLKAFRDDLLVIASNELVFPAGTPNPYDAPVKPAPAAKQPADPLPGVGPQPAVGLVRPAVKVLPAQIEK